MNTHRGRRRLLGLTLLALTGFGGAIPAQAAARAVNEVGREFTPNQVDIAVNDKVVWTNRSNESHTVTFDNGPDLHAACDPDALLQVGCQAPGGTVEYTFTVPGHYPYHCKLHKGMAGSVVVAAAPSTTATTEPASSTSSPLEKSNTTTTTRATTSTSSTTATTRPLATSSTVISSTTTTPDTSSVLLPGEPPPLAGESTSSAGGQSGDGNDSGSVALIVGLLLAVSAGGGYLLWRLRPGRA